MSNSRILGQQGESLAISYLQQKGYVVLEHNYRCRLGEMDIVALDGRDLVFIEVKTRTSLRYGYPYQAVNAKKQKRYYLVSAYYRACHRQYKDFNCRFDIVEVYLLSSQENSINHIQNAFLVDDSRYN